MNLEFLEEPELQFGGGPTHRYPLRHHELWPT